MIIDSHCHLNYEPILSSLDLSIKRAKENGIDYMLTISTKDKEYEKILEIVNRYKSVFGTYGIHPHEAKLHKEIKSNDILQKLSLSDKIIGVGETGLDFFYNHSDKEDQIDSFLEHIEASQKSNLPLIVHTRSAEDDTYNILKKATNKKELKILIHCFTGSKQFAKKLLDINAYISASGVITFKKSQELASTFKEIPLNRILVETDSPYLTPEPLRGKPNEPSYITHTIKFLAQLKNSNFDDISKITSNNFFNLFGKLS